MHNLPKRQKTITVEPEGYDGVSLEFATIGPEEAFELMEAVGLSMKDIEGDSLSFTLKPSAAVPMLKLARENIVGASGLAIDGEPFNVEDPEHVASLTPDMLMQGVNELLSYPFLQDAAGKDSRAPAEPSPKASTRSARSAVASAGSS